jgi:phosphoglucomutase
MTYLEKVQVWKEYKDLDASLKKELELMNDAELKDAFTNELEFGTAGLRGILGPGTNRMNIYLVRKATLGFGRYLAQFDNALERGVCIAHDNRHHSRDFAVAAAHVLTKLGYHVYLFEDLRPTPELSFSVRQNNAVGGIMITASHNPKEYNGYKIYDSEGCQLLPDAANDVKHEIDNIDDMFDIPYSTDDYGITVIGKEMDDLYISNVKSIVRNNNYKKNFKITYTPLHGTGQVFIPNVLQSLGYDVTPLKCQMTPDPDFSGVKTSNPENKEAYDESIELAKEIGADVCLATDPDADRLGVAVKHNGEYVLLTGNQSATVIFDYLVKMAKKNNEDLSNSYMFTTIVSSSLPVEIAKKNGLNYKLSLTGFKYIGNFAKEIEGKSRYFFGFEESYGCLIKDSVRDKDSLQACMMLCEVCAYYYEQGMDLVDALEAIYKEYGFYKDGITNITLKGLEGKEKIKSTMNYFKTHEINLPSFKILSKLNVSNSTIKDYITGETLSTDLPKSDVVKYELEGGSWFVLRPSGTEPKLKVYYQMVGSTEDECNALMEKLQEEVKAIVLPLTK